MLYEILEVMNLLDGQVRGHEVVELLRANGAEQVSCQVVEGKQGHTEFVCVSIPGAHGKQSGGTVPTLGVIGRLGGIGARPERIGIVSDADGAITAVAVALKILRMRARGDALPGDVIVCTHICPDAPTLAHDPVPFMDSPVDMATMNAYEVSSEMDAILSVDATKGNVILNRRGVAITPTVKDGYLLPVSKHMMELLSYATGRLPMALPLCQYDITPYGNGLNHINSILQPSTATSAPVIGVALVAQATIPGCATGACQETDLRDAGMLCIEAAKAMARFPALFYDEQDYGSALALYGELTHFKK